MCGLDCDGLLISLVPSLFDVLGVEVLKLVLCYLGLGILYGFFAAVRIVELGFLRLCVTPWDFFSDVRVFLGRDPVLYRIVFVGLFLVYEGGYPRVCLRDRESHNVFSGMPVNTFSNDGPPFVCFGWVCVCAHCDCLKRVVLFSGA